MYTHRIYTHESDACTHRMYTHESDTGRTMVSNGVVLCLAPLGFTSLAGRQRLLVCHGLGFVLGVCPIAQTGI
jgi:hypothetical protein